MLGNCLYKKLQEKYQVKGLCFNTPSNNLVKIDISNPEAARNFISENNFDVIIHCAAIRSPDSCLNDPETAEKVNSVGSKNIAEAAGLIGAYLVYISTDYVFSGDNAPYCESDTPSPVNLYGKTKLDGEMYAQKVKKHLIVRIPALYRTDLNDHKSIITMLAGEFKKNKPLSLDCKTVRYYTYADDISTAVAFLIKQEQQDIIHLSAKEKTSKADFARKVGVQMGYPPEAVLDCQPAVTGDKRPLDSHLSTDIYDSLGGPEIRPFSEVIKNLPQQV